MTAAVPDVTVVVLAYGDEPYLEPCVESALASRGVTVEVVLVDNGCTDGAVDRLDALGSPALRVVRPGANLGYAAGCNEGVRHARAPVVALVNADAVVDPDAIAHLRAVVTEPGVGIATASIRLDDAPELLNSAGNDIHFLGLSWSGHFREPAVRHSVVEDVTGASGAGMALTREAWDLLGGFEPVFFMYHDDAELSLRCHLAGRRVVFVPDAVIRHRYEFTRNPNKLYLIERNRLIMVLTTFERRTLALIAPALMAVELATLVLALREGWWRSKLRAWAWLVTNRRFLGERRRRLQSARVRRDHELSGIFVARIDPGNYELSPVVRLLNVVLVGYWRFIRRVI